MSTAFDARGPGVPAAGRLRWPLALRLAAREFRAGLKGFYVFIGCVALGVAVIAAVGSLSDALQAGLSEQGRLILGGDVALSRMHIRATPSEQAWLNSRGQLSETATMRTMARTLDGEEQALIELKSVDGAYPLAGVARARDVPFAEALARGAVADPVLLERLGLKVGDRFRIGAAEVVVAAHLVSEPDGLIDRITYGPRVFVSHATLTRTGLVQPGALVRWRYALALAERNGDDTAAALDGFRAGLSAALPESGFTVTDRRDPSPQVTRMLERLRQFLTLLGLTALLVGGVGVANAVATFLDRRRKVIATMKCVGASGATVFWIFLAEVLSIAAIGVLVGLLIGLAVPPLLATQLSSYLPVATKPVFSSATLALATAYGFLVSLLFALWPLGRAERIGANVLFREDVAPSGIWPPPVILMSILATASALAMLAILSSDQRWIAIAFVGGLIAVFALFLGLGALIARFTRMVGRPRQPELRLAIANIGAPGGLTSAVVLSLGSGLSLLVAVALTDASLVAELKGRLPEHSPSYFVLDIPKGELDAFKTRVARETPGSVVDEAPMLRGRLVALKGIPAEKISATPESAWVLNGDRGLTYAAALPEGQSITAGSWWPERYDGPALVSFEAELAEGLGVGVGDSVTVNVLGRNVTAKIANLREVKWESLALNFVMIFSPNTLSGAPHNLLATITLPKEATIRDEVRLARELGRAFPAVTAIRVKDAIDAFEAVFSKIMIAVRVAGGVTLVAGALVLAGAMATAQRRRILEAVILKALGATRRRIVAAHVAEYLILATATALAAVVLGSAAAWLAVTQAMELEFAWSWTAVASALTTSVALVLLFGAIGTWAVLSARPVPYLRSE